MKETTKEFFKRMKYKKHQVQLYRLGQLCKVVEENTTKAKRRYNPLDKSVEIRQVTLSTLGRIYARCMEEPECKKLGYKIDLPYIFSKCQDANTLLFFIICGYRDSNPTKKI